MRKACLEAYLLTHSFLEVIFNDLDTKVLESNKSG